MMRSTLKNHMKRFGQDGQYTYHAGLTLEQAADIGADIVKRSMLHSFKARDEVFIRGCDIKCQVKKALGSSLVLQWPVPDWRSFDAVNVEKKGRWSYGDVEIHKGHVELVEWTD